MCKKKIFLAAKISLYILYSSSSCFGGGGGGGGVERGRAFFFFFFLLLFLFNLQISGKLKLAGLKINNTSHKLF